jgi:nucleotide-binding universal stress UspA family protein
MLTVSSLSEVSSMFGTVLLAVDGSKHAEKAVDLATKLAQIDHDEVVIVHVTEVMPARFQVPPDVEYVLDEHAIRLAKQYAENLEAAGVKARTEFPYIRYGHAARVICDLAEDLDAGLIVMGSRGKSDLAAILVGSVTHKVLHLTDRPVLIAR